MKLLALVIVFLLYTLPNVASAHAFGQNYALPLPAWMYMFAGGAVVLLSFIGVNVFGSQHTPVVTNPNGGVTVSRLVIQLLKSVSVFVWIIALCAGLYGSSASSANFLVGFFWIVVMLGGVYISALFGTRSVLLSPFRTLAIYIGANEAHVRYPKSARYIPALVVYIACITCELSPRAIGIHPATLAVLLLIYTLYTLIGAFVFGVRDWFLYADFFSVLFRLIGNCSPLYYKNHTIHFRMPFSGLFTESATHPIEVLCIIFMLSSTMFDGLKETIIGSGFVLSLPGSVSWQSFFGICIVFIFCVLVYGGIIFLTRAMERKQESLTSVGLRYAYSLLPIALAYHIAHYFGLFIVEIQNVLIHFSDPFSRGWNVFGTADMVMRPDIVNTQAIWHVQLMAIIVGHVIAVYVAHRQSRGRWISEFPMLIVMVVYTMFGLWILAQPLTVGM